MAGHLNHRIVASADAEQAILADTFSVEKRGQAFALYGMAVVVAPAIGPTLGGWITDNYNWHWIFFINLPIGIFSLWLTNIMVEDPPQSRSQRAAKGGIGGREDEPLIIERPPASLLPP